MECGRQKVLRKLFVSSKNARFYLTCGQPNLHDNLMQETCASFLRKFLDCVSRPLRLCDILHTAVGQSIAITFRHEAKRGRDDRTSCWPSGLYISSVTL